MLGNFIFQPDHLKLDFYCFFFDNLKIGLYSKTSSYEVHLLVKRNNTIREMYGVRYYTEKCEEKSHNPCFLSNKFLQIKSNMTII